MWNAIVVNQVGTFTIRGLDANELPLELRKL